MKIADLIWQQSLHWRAHYNVGPADLRILLNPDDGKRLNKELAELMPEVISPLGAIPDCFHGMDIIISPEVELPMVVMVPHDFELTLIS